jgi:hypothetical protein
MRDSLWQMDSLAGWRIHLTSASTSAVPASGKCVWAPWMANQSLLTCAEIRQDGSHTPLSALKWWVIALRASPTTWPGVSVEIKRVIAEDDLVVTHDLVKLTADDRGLAGIDIFRLQNGKIVEHWDARQPVPEKSANKNTMF